MVSFKLKPVEEIISTITEDVKKQDKILLVLCNKCHIEFKEIPSELEAIELKEILLKQNYKVDTILSMDFLCNKYLTEKRLHGFNDVDAILVISCGIGVQSIAEIFSDKLVYTMTNSFATSSGYHGVSLSEKQCMACAQCYLNFTCGICPIIDCSKSLINGPCGGAREGKCETNNTKYCAWERIYNRFTKQNRIKYFITSPVKIHDFSKPNIQEKLSYKITVYEKRTESFHGGIYPEEKKYTSSSFIETFPEPELVAILLSQHTGKICNPIVKVGDKVKFGQKIGEIDTSGIYAPIHSSVSGKVRAIEEYLHPTLKRKVLGVIIESDGEDTKDASILPNNPETLSPKELLDIIREKGIVGMGGGMFPTHIKLMPPKPPDTLIVNGCECEPVLTGDERVMIEETEKIFVGIYIISKILSVKNVYIAIEDNKQDAILKIKDFMSSYSTDLNISVVELKTKYPQGAERVLIKKITGREVPLGGLPYEVNVIVNNVSTIVAVAEAVKYGLPLIRRVITIAGENVAKPGNYRIKIGTLLSDISKFCFNSSQIGSHLVKMGGPMMGIIQDDLSVPVIKGTTGIVSVKRDEINPDIYRSCIRCGRCMDVCPMELYPLYFIFYAQKEAWEELDKFNFKNCIECGCCSYICSSKLPIVEIVKKAKKIYAGIK